MSVRRFVLVAMMVFLVAGTAVADTKVVKSSHTDAFAVMGQQQPAKDEESVTWIGDARLRVDRGGTTFIVRPDLKSMFFINHSSRTYSVLSMPVDIASMLPPGMGEQMMQMMKFEVTVTPTDETRTVGQWKARRYNMTMTSPMMQMRSEVWTTTDIDIDVDQFNDLSEQIVRMQPGMAEAIGEMRKMKGFQVMTAAKMQIMGNEVSSSEEVLSVDEMAAPPGTYDPPSDYSEEEFDFMKMQGAQG